MFSGSLDHSNVLVFEKALEVDQKVSLSIEPQYPSIQPLQMQSSWLSTLSSTQRVLPYVSEDLVAGLERILSSYSNDVSRQTFTLDPKSEYTFFSGYQPATLTVSIAKPFIFDLFLALAIGGYLTGLYYAAEVSFPLLLSTSLTSLSDEQPSALNRLDFMRNHKSNEFFGDCPLHLGQLSSRRTTRKLSLARVP